MAVDNSSEAWVVKKRTELIGKIVSQGVSFAAVTSSFMKEIKKVLSQTDKTPILDLLFEIQLPQI